MMQYMHEHNEYPVQVYDEIQVALDSTINFNYVSYSVPLSSRTFTTNNYYCGRHADTTQ